VKDDSARAARAGRPRLAHGIRLGRAAESQEYWLASRTHDRRVRLNASAGAILARCDGSLDLDELIAELERHFGTEGIRAEVVEFLERARRDGWIE